MPSGGSQQLTATASDQFGNALSSQPGFTWSLTSGVGSVSGSGLYTAPIGAGGAAVVSASSGGIIGSDSIAVTAVTNGIWTNGSGGSWLTSGNWQGGGIPAGSGYTADFSTLNLSADATVTLDGARTIGNLVFGDTTPSNNWTLNTGTGGSLLLSATSGTPGITVKNRTATINAALSGTQGLTVSGSGLVTFTSAGNNYTGSTAINSGTLKFLRAVTNSSPTTVNTNGTLVLDNNGAIWGFTTPAISLNGGTLSYYSSGNFWTVLNTGTVTSQAGTSSTITIQGVGTGGAGFYPDPGFQGSGTVTVNNLTAGEGLALRNNTATFSGTIIVNGIASTSVGAGSGIAVGGCTTGLQNADIAVNGTMELLNTGMGWANTASGVFQMGALSGTGVVVANYSATGGITTVTLGLNGHGGTYSGTIANGNGDTLYLVKSGAGTQVLSGSSTYTGTTTVNGGTLSVMGSIASSTVTVNSGATLSGTGTIGVVTINSGGMLAPGVSGSGSLSLNSKALSLSGTVAMQSNASTGASTNVQGISALTYGGTLNVTNLSGTFAAGNTYTLFSAASYSGSLATINLPTLPSGLVWNTANLAVNGAILVSGSLPGGWSGQDIGSVGVTGSSSYGGGVYTVIGSGADIQSTADAFQFVSQSLTGDGEIRAQVTSQTNSNASAKAGVMIRSGSDAGAVNVMVALTPGNGFTFQYRAAANGTTAFTTGSSNAAPNNWVRLVKSGTLITGYVSSSGTSWTQMGTVNLSMTNSVTVGLAVTSHSNSVTSTATFANVSVTPFPSPWQSADVGSPGQQGSGEYFNGAYTLKGAGNISSTADNFHFVYQTLSGTAVARSWRGSARRRIPGPMRDWA